MGLRVSTFQPVMRAPPPMSAIYRLFAPDCCELEINTNRRHNVGSMLGQRHKPWANIG